MTERIKLSKINLDTSNQRHSHEKYETQEQAIEFLVKECNVLAVAKDIAQKGLNQMELLGVLKTGDNYTVLEGNRRVCALKLLHDPSLINIENVRKRFLSLKDDLVAEIPSKVTCIVYKSRKECSHWLKLRHASNQPAGLMSWPSKNKAQYTDENKLAYELLEYAEAKGLLHSEDPNKDYPFTTVVRYLGTDKVRDVLGIIDKTALRVSWPVKTFNEVLSYFLEDLRSKKITSRKKGDSKEDREEYAETLRNETSHINKRRIQAKLLGPKPVKPSLSDKQKKVIRRSSGLVPPSWEGFTYLNEKTDDWIIFKILKELQGINVTRYSISTTMLLRLLIKLTFNRYLKVEAKAKNKRWEEKELRKTYLEIVGLLNKATKNKKFTLPLEKALSEKGHCLAPESLNAVAHGNNAPDHEDLKNHWFNFSKIIAKVLLLGKSDK